MSDPPYKFELNRMPDRSDDAILAEIRRVAALALGAVLTSEAFERSSRISRSTVSRRFGSWADAMNAAGLSDRLHSMNVAMTDAEILTSLKDLSVRLEKTELTVRDVELHLPIGFDRLRRRWGSARAAFEAAGLTVSPSGRRYSDDERFENLLRVWTHYGRPPTYREMGSSPSTVGGKAYMGRYGTWFRALSAFVDRANVTEGGESSFQDAATQASIVSTSVTTPAKRGPRDIPLGLRFKILRRDRFRCVLCGDNPPKNSDCVLHVDHILPWSRGGETVFENLRTLCEPCNLGRSNRFTD